MTDTDLDSKIEDLPVADNHGFAFGPETSKLKVEQLNRVFSLGGPTVFGTKPVISRDEARLQIESAAAYKYTLGLFSDYFKCEKNAESIVNSRNTRSRKDFAGYLQDLFGDVNIKAMVIDSGFQPVSVEEFRSYVPAKVSRVLRLEPLIKKLLETEKIFASFLSKFDQELEDSIRSGGVGFKTVIAYRTGLDLGVIGEEEAKQSFDRILEKTEPVAWFGPRVKVLRDHLVKRAAEVCRKHDKVLQIHTGLGDTDIVGSKCNPILLQDFLKDEQTLNTKIVLIHGGFPYIIEASWLANVLPNVYLELSTPLPPYYLPAQSSRRFMETMQQTPSRKIVYGSDADLPESHWISAKIAKISMKKAMNALVDLEMASVDEAHQMAKDIFYENANRLYRFS